MIIMYNVYNIYSTGHPEQAVAFSGVLVKGLLEVLQKQYDHEAQLVLGGKQLMHTEFFKTLVAFCCDLGLDQYIAHRYSDTQKWSWFIK